VGPDHAENARECLLKLADAIEAHAELCQLESLNCGKPLHCVGDEIPAVVDVFRFFAGAAAA
jgi:aminobutyraldehyde dehydrogenase